MTATYSVRKAIVTGGAQGIGAEISRRLACEGMTVTVLDINADRASETAEKISTDTGTPTYSFGCDVSDRAELRRAFEKAAEAMGGLDTYVGNAGITRDRMFHRLSDDDWDRVIAVNLTGVYEGLKSAAPWLRREGPGRVVLISSVVAKSGNLGQMNYIAAKAGVVGLVRSVAVELAKFGTTVNGIRPGFIDTGMTAAMPEEAKDALLATNPLGRIGQPADIAGGVAYLCSDDASFVTGQMLDINGGAVFD
jgi:3-oxoacyl-[acyl-carrier protein] reductase